VKFVKPGDVDPLFPINRIQLRWFGHATKMPRKNSGGKSCWLHPRESGPEVVQGPGGVTTSPTLLGLVLVWSQQNYLRLLLTVRYFVST